MKTILEFLASHGGMLLIGVSAVLLLGVALVMVQRQPIGRQRIAEGTMGVCLIWLVMACVPLPRLVFDVDQKKPAPTRTLEMYEPAAGDEVIAAEVFKVPRERREVREKSMGIGVPLPMQPSSSANTRTPPAWRLSSVLAEAYLGGVGVCIV